MPRAELQAWTEDAGLHLDDEAWARLETLISLWQRYGRAFNLVGSIERGALVEHVREGLLARRVAERALVAGLPTDWIDVGSGAGLPGLVVAASTDWRVRLIEPRERRAAFLELAGNTVARDRISVVRARVERSTWTKIGEIGEILGPKATNLVASARAVFAPGEWLEIARSGLPPRAIVLVHVAAGVSHVGGETPTWHETAGAHAVLGFRAGAVL